MQHLQPTAIALVLWVSTSMAPALAADFDLGLRYDRSRTGHGLEIHKAADRYAVFFYTYDQDARPEWFLCNGRMINGVMLGDCLRYTSEGENLSDATADGSQFASFTLDYIAPEQSAACQDGVDRSDAQQLATFSWRTKDEFHEWCTEFLPVGSAYPERYYGGIWYGGDAGGYGCSMSHMDNTLSAICYFYDANGDPRWVFGIGDPMQAPLEMIHYVGFCRECETIERKRSVAGTLTLTLDPDSVPGSGFDQAELVLAYPETPGGRFERSFVLTPLTDGSQLGSHAIPDTPIQTGESLENWQEDLLFMVDQIRATHPNPFHTTSEAEFESRLESLRRRLPFLTGTQLRFELLRFGGSLGRYGRDGHTSLVPANSPVLPLQFYWFSDGVFVVDALPPYEQLIGARVTSIGNTDVNEVLLRMSLVLSRDNQTTLQWFVPTAMLFADLYRGVGVLAPGAENDPVSLQYRKLPGPVESVEVSPIDVPSYSQWKTLGRNTLPDRPVMYLSDTSSAFWYRELPDENTLYVQFNAVVPFDAEGQTIEAFSNRLGEAFATMQPERVIIDLRHNNGGDNTTYSPLLNFLSDPEVNREGRLFVIAGRQTFSAAMNFIADVEAATTALFVGESSGGSPYHYGDSEDFLLPHSQLLLQVSSRVHPASIQGDDRLAIPADIASPLSSQQYASDQDPALQAILDYPARG